MSKAQSLTTEVEWDAATWARRHVEAAGQPAALVAGDGTLICSNEQAQWLLKDGVLPAALRSHVVEARLVCKVQMARVVVPAKSGDETARRIDVTLVPVPVGMVLLLAKDSTLDANLVNALAASRQLFRDLALCSNDFAFETDAASHFSYASPNGLVGYSAEELHGARPRQFFGHAGVAALFSPKSAVHLQEIWTEDKEGKDACVVVTSIPIHDSEGAWCGARGVVRNVTSLRLHEQQIAQAHARDVLLQAVVTAMRAQVEPRRMMLAAADALCGATGTDFVSVRVEDPDLCVSIGRDTKSANRLACNTIYHGSINGAVELARNDQMNPLQAAERDLLDSIAPHLGIAIALARLVKGGPSVSVFGV